MYRVITILAIVGGLAVSNVDAQAPGERTVLAGVYTEAQAARGEIAYTEKCSRCHGADLSGTSAPALAGKVFIDRWREDMLDSLYDFVRLGMPPGRNTSSGVNPIADETYLDIVTYILKVNDYPSGASDLTVDAVSKVLLIGKDGPKPVPDGSLVMTVGCLSQAPTGAWILFSATEPGRNRRPNDSTAAERTASMQKPLGRLIFRLADLEAAPDFSPAAHKGHKVQAKGYIVRQPNAERINISAIEMLAETCTP
jgi:S-disulfanyl-L-cysteine oxidoreductase SoxD